jgi:hypothetical protein
MSSLAQTVGSWFRIPFEGRMSAFSLYLCCPVLVAALRRADHSSKECYQPSIKFTISELINSELEQAVKVEEQQ